MSTAHHCSICVFSLWTVPTPSCVWSTDDCGPFGSALTPEQNEAVCPGGGGSSPYGGSRVTARFSGWGRAEGGRVTKDGARCTT